MLKCFENFILDITNYDSIVDIGCGDGINMLKLKELGYEFIEGCDQSEELVKICKSNNLNVIISNITNLIYQDNQFDITLCMSVLHHVETRELRTIAIKELIRITKNDGLIFISVNANQEYNKNDQIIKHGDNELFYHLFDSYELVDLCNELVGCNRIDESYECSHRIMIIQVKK